MMEIAAMSDLQVVEVYAWIDYYVRTENFDRTLPGVFHPRDPDVWMPLPEWMPTVQQNAHRTRRQVESERCVMLLPGLSRTFALRMKHAERVAMLRSRSA
jgi:hypothetical protein